MSGWRLIGNSRALNALASAVSSGSPARSYIFAGPERVGKAAAALRLAQALNCTADDPPCLSCETCRRIGEAKFADFQTVTVEATTDGPAHKAISVEQMRDVEATVALAPYEGRKRVVVIDPADAMSDEAQNALLTTLEEPPPHVVFVLVSADADRLLETVRSRCRRIDFGLVAAAEIEAGLIERGTDAEQAAVLARLAAGRPGWALEAAAAPALRGPAGVRRDAHVSPSTGHPRCRIGGTRRLSTHDFDVRPAWRDRAARRRRDPFAHAVPGAGHPHRARRGRPRLRPS